MRTTRFPAPAGHRAVSRRRHEPLALTVGALALCVALPGLGREPPSELRYADGVLSWRSDAPSVNVYENGVYTLTLHGRSRYEGASEGVLYQLVAHDHGRDFSRYSDGVVAGRGAERDDDDDDDDDEEIEWDVARVYLELNDTDGDLGFHALFDGEPWNRASIESPSERILFRVAPRGPLAAQGMSEVFFESDEPSFDELDPSDFFERFPEGEYEIEGRTLEGEELESEWRLSHVLPEAPANLIVSGAALPVGCEEEDGPIVAKPLTIGWDPVLYSHPTLGRAGDIELVAYQVVVEREEPTRMELTLDVEPMRTSLTIPDALIGPDDELKVEVLAIATNGNQVATESCFVSAD